jgi:ribosomal-protein-alanine N-acetyltransferase
VSEIRLQLIDGWHLSGVRDGDQAAFVEQLGDGDVSLAIPVIPHPYDRQAADTWVRIREQVRTTRGVEPCLAIRDPSGTLFGAVGVDDQRVVTPVGELGYWIGQSARGRGIVSAAVAAFVPYARDALGLEQLTAHVQTWNVPSVRILEKAGFARVAKLEAHTKTRTGVHDVFSYRLDLGA